MTKSELAWLAGFFEGEACFLLERSRRGGPKIHPRIEVVTTDEDVLRRVATLAGGYVNGPYEPSPSPYNRKLTWRWRIYGKQALSLMKRLQPFMGTRRSLKIQECIDGA